MMARLLVRAGHQVRVVGIYPQDQRPDAAYQDDQGVQVYRLPEPGYRFGWVVARYQLFKKIAAWSQRGEIDLVEVPDYEGAATGWPGLPIPVIVRLHGSSSYFAADQGLPVKRIQFWLERATLRRADFWCSVSRYTAEKTQQLFSLRTPPAAILYNPVELPPAVLQQTRSADQILFSGTLTERKGIVSLINAWTQVHHAHPTASLHIYGKARLTADGQPMQAYLLSLLDEAAKRTVIFHSRVPRAEVLNALQTARAAVFPSYSEAFALAPLEAMAAGCPTINSARSSGPELIEHERDGLLVAPDRSDQIADAIIRVLNEDGLAERLGEAGRKRIAQSFSTDTILAQNEAFYRRCLESFRTRTTLRHEAIREQSG